MQSKLFKGMAYIFGTTETGSSFFSYSSNFKRSENFYYVYLNGSLKSNRRLLFDTVSQTYRIVENVSVIWSTDFIVDPPKVNDAQTKLCCFFFLRLLLLSLKKNWPCVDSTRNKFADGTQIQLSWALYSTRTMHSHFIYLSLFCLLKSD